MISGRDLILALRLAVRDLRGGFGGAWAFLACLALGVAAVTAVSTLSAAVSEGIRLDARSLLGGDLEISQSHLPLPAPVLDFLAARGQVSQVVRMRAMARAVPAASPGPPGLAGPAAPAAPAAQESAEGSQGRSTLAELKGVDPGYPLYGRFVLAGGLPLADALASRDGLAGAVAEPALAERLGLKVGDTLQVGDARFRLAGIIVSEPDKGASFFNLGPRLVVGLEGLERSGLLAPGSVVFYLYRVRLPEGGDAAELEQDLAAAFPDPSWRVRDVRSASPVAGRFMDRMAMYLTLVGLTALLVGGIGVAGAVRAHLSAKTATIATLRSLGAPRRLVFDIYFCQVLILAGLGILLGLAVGSLFPPLLAPVLSEHLAVTVRTGIYLKPLCLASAYGLLVALAFTLWPLSAAGGTSPAILFRGYADVAASSPTRRARLAVVLVAAALAGLAILSSDQRRIGLGFVIGTVVCFVLYRGFAWLVTLAAGLLVPKDPRLRLGLGNIRRPGSPAASVVFSLGLGLTVLIAVALVDGNLQAEIREQIPREAPAFFFIDVQPDNVERLREIARTVPGVRSLDIQPSIRGRIVRINSVPPDEVAIDPDVAWAVRSDRGITFAAEQPKATRVVAGQWWPPDYDGPPIISFDAAIARGFHVGIGDTLTVNVMGREITARIVNLRDIDWLTLSINHTIIFAPGVLEGAPLSYIATAYANPGAEEPLYRAVTAALPNVSVVHIKDVLQTVSDNLTNIGLAVRAVASVTLLSGLLVLAESVRADLRRRYHDAVILKVLGATRGDILLALAAEYAFLGLATACLAAILGAAISYVFMDRVMSADWVPLPGIVALTALGGVLVTLALGLGSVWRILGQKAWPVLRNE